MDDNIEDYFYDTEEEKYEGSIWTDHNLDNLFQCLMDKDNMWEDIIIKNIWFDDIFEEGKVMSR